MSLKTYISNPEISNGTSKVGIVSFEKEFLFSFLANKNDDLDLIFSIVDENINDLVTLKISNKNFIDFTISEDKTYITSAKTKKIKGIEFFGEVFDIKDNLLYKKIKNTDSPLEKWVDYYYDGDEIYARSDSSLFELIIEKDGYIIKKNIVNDNIDTKLVEVSLYHGNELRFNEILENENILLSDTFNCRFVIVDGKILSLLIKEENAETYKKVRTFSFPKRFSQGGIKLAIDESMELNQLSVSFLKADV